MGKIPGEGIGYPLQYSWASLVAQLVQNLPAMWETLRWENPWRREQLPTPVFWPGKFHGLYGVAKSRVRLSLSLCFQKHAPNLPKAWKAFCPFPAKAPPGVCSGFARVLSRVRLTVWLHGLYPAKLHGILQARILEWVGMPSSRGHPDPGIKPTSVMSPALAGGFFTVSATWEAGLRIALSFISQGVPSCWDKQGWLL